MAALEVSDSWSSWKISHQMDRLEFTWRPPVPARKLEPARLSSLQDGVQRDANTAGLRFQLGGRRPDALGPGSMISAEVSPRPRIQVKVRCTS